jgi:uncharacterized protein YbcV (DUF1398 family)
MNKVKKGENVFRSYLSYAWKAGTDTNVWDLKPHALP